MTQSSGSYDTQEELTIMEPTMNHMGAMERPMMEYLFSTVDGTISSIANLPSKLTTLRFNRPSFKLFDLVCSSLVCPTRILINIFLVFLRYVIFSSLMELVMMLLDLNFPFSLSDTAKDWLQFLPASSITTRASLKKFLAKYFPYAKTYKMLNNLTSFVQLDKQSLYDAWEHFKACLEDALIMSYLCGRKFKLSIMVSLWLIELLLMQLQVVPSYAKFLKEVLSKKRKWGGGETVKLNEECSAILQNKLPPKLKDPGVFLSLAP
ncbi:UNVERIFIED_CONTAM: hypothetical protein Scaly_0081700 [Sesamum calycinum]|uniref:Retrotransposon gag domain-containing protein n=1 Tax=Sesamum calycinum TaxID=2727403 RepID=A0AAW2SWY3_9LAMI